MHRILKTLLLILIITPLLFCQPFYSDQSATRDKYTFIVRQQNSSGFSADIVIDDSFAKDFIKDNNPGWPVIRKFLAVPNGASPSVKVVSFSKKIFKHIELPELHTDIHKMVSISGSIKIRGINTAIIEVNPFIYDEASAKLTVIDKITLNISYNGGSGVFGEKRLRNRWWDGIYQYLFLNYESIPKIKYASIPDHLDEGYDYVIITPDNPGYLSWADSLKNFRTLQGINTGIVTLNDIGGNDPVLIENFIDNAYITWEIPPAAILFLGDYGNGSATGNGIISPVYNNYCVSDNIYGDVDEDQLPDIIVSRITAQNTSDLESIVSKILTYERTPPSFPDFYNTPLCVSGWASTGTSVLCSEIIFGFYENILNKQPVRQYAGYGGGAPPAWPSDPYSNSLVQGFGPAGLGYVPATPSYLTNWTGSAEGINNTINSGTFAVYYRGQGSENSWGEPVYTINDLSGLNNVYPPFVVSIASLTGKFNGSNDCLAEAFLKHPNGALGVIAASEITYSAVSSDYGWGLYDYLWPQFLPGIQLSLSFEGALPAFANAAAKYFVEYNNSLYYTHQQKVLTYHLFHYFGDAFSTVYTELPQYLTVVHDTILTPGETIFTISADEDALICLTVNGEIIAVETGTGLPLDITIPPQSFGDTILVTVTKQNYYRYEKAVSIQSPIGIEDNGIPGIKSFSLYQNYPNPFNPATTIGFSVKEKSNVKITILNAIGEEVAIVMNEETEAGYHQVEFSAKGGNAVNLPTGVYFYQIRAGSFVETKKMILLR